MNFIQIDHSKSGNPKGGIPAPPAVTIHRSTFTFNNLAIVELSQIWGGLDFSLQLFVSECRGYLGVGVRKPEAEKTSASKSISSREARDMLKPHFVGRKTINLTRKGDMLIGCIAESI